MTGVYFNPNLITQNYLNASGAMDSAGNTSAGSYMDTDIGAAMLGMGAAGGGFGPMSFGNNSQWMKNQEEVEDWQIERQLALKKKSEAAEQEGDGQDKVMARKACLLQQAALHGKQDTVHRIYNELLNEERKRLKELGCKDVSDEQVKANVEEAYFNGTHGGNLIDDISSHGDDELIHGFKQGAFLGLGSLITQKRSREDNLCEITGEEKSNSEEFKKWAGVVLSGGLGAAAIFLLGKAGMAAKAAKIAKTAA